MTKVKSSKQIVSCSLTASSQTLQKSAENFAHPGLPIEVQKDCWSHPVSNPPSFNQIHSLWNRCWSCQGHVEDVGIFDPSPGWQHAYNFRTWIDMETQSLNHVQNISKTQILRIDISVESKKGSFSGRIKWINRAGVRSTAEKGKKRRVTKEKRRDRMAVWIRTNHHKVVQRFPFRTTKMPWQN